jgi:hypothetical protein
MPSGCGSEAERHHDDVCASTVQNQKNIVYKIPEVLHFNFRTNRAAIFVAIVGCVL